MNILAFVDSHDQPAVLETLRAKAQDADLIICAGDITIFGSHLGALLKTYNAWNKPFYIIHGNHEDADELEHSCKRFANIHFAHRRSFVLGGITFLFWGGGGFAQTDRELQAHHDKHWKGVKGPCVLVTHGPPYNTKIDQLYDHVGSRTIRAIIEELKPLYHLCGHLHEHDGKEDRIGSTQTMNLGRKGKMIVMNQESTEFK